MIYENFLFIPLWEWFVGFFFGVFLIKPNLWHEMTQNRETRSSLSIIRTMFSFHLKMWLIYEPEYSNVKMTSTDVNSLSLGSLYIDVNIVHAQVWCVFSYCWGLDCGSVVNIQNINQGYLPLWTVAMAIMCALPDSQTQGLTKLTCQMWYTEIKCVLFDYLNKKNDINVL